MRSRIVALSLALLSSACGPGLYQEVEAPHPLATPGRITAPPIERLNEACKDQMGSAEACTSRARLTKVSNREVCAAVTLGENEEAERYADKTRFALVSSTGEVDEGKVRDRDDRPATIRG